MRVWISLPSYDYRYSGNTMMSVLHCGPIYRSHKLALPQTAQQADEIFPAPIAGSLLPRVFNESLGQAVSRGFNIFVMMHADIGAEPGWLTKILAVQSMSDADVVSVVVPLKDKRALTSTAVHTSEEQYRKLSLDECRNKCQPVFGVDDPYLKSVCATHLLVNTGLFCMRLDRPWLRKWSGFRIVSGIEWQGDKLRVGTVSEDWDMSERLHDLQCRIVATTTIKVQHIGAESYE
jgi:hypothetical protein